MRENGCDCEAIFPKVIKEVADHMPEESDMELIASFFKMLGDKTRIRIMCALKQREMCAGDIAVLLGMTKSAVSHQLAMLRQMRQVKVRKDGKIVLYSLDDEHIVDIIEEAFIHVEDM